MEKNSLGKKLSILAKSQGKSQTAIADNLGLPPSQINRFLKGHSDCSANNLVLILNELGINLEEIVSQKIRKHGNISESEIESVNDCVQFLFKSLDNLGQQAYLSNLAWAAKLSKKGKFPNKVDEILKKELDLI